MYAVSKKVNESKKNVFSDVLKETNLGTSDDLIKKIKEMVTMFDIKENVTRKLANKNEIYTLINEMITPGRSDNFILPVTQEFIKEILEESLR